MNTKRKLIGLFAVLVVIVGALSASMVMASAEYDPHNEEKWGTDLSAAKERAQAENKPVLVYFWSESCAACKEFHGTLRSQDSVQNSVDKYVLVALEYSESPDLREKYDVSGTPTVVVLSPDGEYVSSFIPTSEDDLSERLNQEHAAATE